MRAEETGGDAILQVGGSLLPRTNHSTGDDVYDDVERDIAVVEQATENSAAPNHLEWKRLSNDHWVGIDSHDLVNVHIRAVE